MKYLRIIKYGNPEVVVKEFDVTSDSEHNIERLERGVNINLNHEGYYTIVVEDKKPALHESHN